MTTAQPKIDELFLVIVSGDQISELAQKLVAAGFYFTRVDDLSGFWFGSATCLLIGISKSRHDQLLALINRVCRTRHSFVPTRMDLSVNPGPPMMIEADLGGATVYVFPVERFEQYL